MTHGMPSAPPPQGSGNFAVGGPPEKPSKGPLLLVIGAVGVLVAGIVGVLVLIVTGGDGTASDVDVVAASTTAAPTTSAPTTELPTTTEAPATTQPDDASTEEPIEVTLTELSRAVVQLVTFNSDDQPLWTGSGTIFDAEGLILTNAHVVEQEPGSPYAWLGVFMSLDPANPPELAYRATVVAFEPELDLAVVAVTEDADGNATAVSDLPTIPLGDSDTVDLGDDIRILGFPGIGGETITLTRGSVSGFNATAGVGNRGWIKTDATITGGNSGGAGINEAGELIGVPTIAGAGDIDEITDCRRIQDTNDDNIIDADDNCTPIGGFINGLRPVNLAAEAIRTGREREPVAPEGATAEGFEADGVSFSAFTFSSGVIDDAPVDDVDILAPGGDQVCAFWDYEGMQDGLVWDALWAVDGEQAEVASIVGETWVGGSQGSWWVCFLAGEAGLVAGVYDLAIWVEGESELSSSVIVGDQQRIDVVVDNQSSTVICFLRMSPTISQSWGEDELGPQQVVDAGASVTLSLPAEQYDLQALSCDVEVIEEIYEVDANATTTIVVTG